MSLIDPRNETEAKQRRASDPKASAFVSANAGSGKTYVLVKRILRLLVDGVDPAKILALTYTTAAAANMSNRVFRDLARWVNLNDEELARELTELDGTTPQAARINAARRLFARAVETPGGLKIQTIHAFCERVLHIFPFEANVPAGFSVVDDVLRADLLDRSKKFIIQQAVSRSCVLGPAFEQIARDIGAISFDRLCGELLFNRELISDVDNVNNYYTDLQKYFGLTRNENLKTIENEMIFGGEDPGQWSLLADQLEAGGINDKKLSIALREAFEHQGEPAGLDLYLSVLEHYFCE